MAQNPMQGPRKFAESFIAQTSPQRTRQSKVGQIFTKPYLQKRLTPEPLASARSRLAPQQPFRNLPELPGSQEKELWGSRPGGPGTLHAVYFYDVCFSQKPQPASFMAV